MDPIFEHFVSGFEQAGVARGSTAHRIGAELKFPLVNKEGTAASFQTVCCLWDYLEERGWQPVQDPMTGQVVGARKAGEQNDTMASCETGFCKPEFSLAHVPDLFALSTSIRELREDLRDFCQDHGVCFLGYGIQPVTPPSKRLLMKKARTSVWDKVFGANRCLPKEDGDDVCLFTINAASHVHVSISQDEAVDAVNVLNGFAGAQIALTANSNIWRGRLDRTYKCVAEKLWDWWMPDANRVGIPVKPFADLEDYVRTIAAFRPVYVERAGKPIVLNQYKSFSEYFRAARAVGLDCEGREVSVVPEKADIDLHSTCYWYNARISRHYTVENRVNDQQPPEDLVCISALTLGLVSTLEACQEVLKSYGWQNIRDARNLACRWGLAGRAGQVHLADLAEKMLDLAEEGLRRRGLGEEMFLAPLRERLSEKTCPADEAAELFAAGGVEPLIAAREL